MIIFICFKTNAIGVLIVQERVFQLKKAEKKYVNTVFQDVLTVIL